MSININPRKPGDSSIACMPLRKNISAPSRPDWKLVFCPICGTECWESDLTRQVKSAKGCHATCTACALRMGSSGPPKQNYKGEKLTLPKCKKCSWFLRSYRKNFCNHPNAPARPGKGARRIFATETKTSPEWCPKRI